MIEFDNYLSPGRKGHLVGIGGVSMSSLAEVLKGMGISVVGSDMNENPNVVSLRETLEPGDIVLTVGAGNVYKIGEDILADNEE